MIGNFDYLKNMLIISGLSLLELPTDETKFLCP